MAQLNTKQFGLLGVHDTGPPEKSNNYTTLVIIHGFSYHAGSFLRLAAYGAKNDTRILLINRRDYPGSELYSETELCLLSEAISDNPSPGSTMEDFVQARAFEIADCLSSLVVELDIPKHSILLTGWSVGCIWTMAFLVHAVNFPTIKVNLSKYIRRITFYDPPSHVFGFPRPDVAYNPMQDQTLAPGEGPKIFPLWVAGYYQHGEGEDLLEQRTALEYPPPTLATMSSEEIVVVLHTSLDMTKFSDGLVMRGYHKHSLGESLKNRLLFPSADNEWAELPLRYLWCDMSAWEMPWGYWKFQEALERVKEGDRHIRTTSITRVRGANHFAHWDQPESTLKILISDDADVVYRSVNAARSLGRIDLV